jgi:hypothetical protein
LHIAEQLHLLTSSGRIVTLLAMPPAWVDISWELVRGERDNVKQISAIIGVHGTAEPRDPVEKLV